MAPRGNKSLSTLTDGEIRELLHSLEIEAHIIFASLDLPHQAGRRTRNLILSAAGLFAGAAISSMTVWGLVATLFALYVLIDNFLEDAEIYKADREARQRLSYLRQKAKELRTELKKRGYTP
ncbi:hypothetical protein FHS78_003377 [Parvibaculum indicum]|uniref:hypothetical protein n=1 Tax=Parvibaculum indicum TaxID=562969 RepID=UPI001423716E|nr:hypothetical protein [Parvibaculum indicum]NIJ43067.1 hypothetical protein [Parvibaculum indicum]